MHLAVSSRSFKRRCCGSLLVSLSLPVPSVLNIRLTAKQHNVVQLTCSSHNLAPVCSSIHMVNLSSAPTLEHMRTLFFFFFGLSSPFQKAALPCYYFLSFSTYFLSASFLLATLPDSSTLYFCLFLVRTLSQVICRHTSGPLASSGSENSFVRCFTIAC